MIAMLATIQGVGCGDQKVMFDAVADDHPITPIP
jgi:hypothetical protein